MDGLGGGSVVRIEQEIESNPRSVANDAIEQKNFNLKNHLTIKTTNQWNKFVVFSLLTTTLVIDASIDYCLLERNFYCQSFPFNLLV